ncbi:MAG TPA: HAMP domain-containing sensor histidine kinase [Gemmatimonadaceae bacterium]|nr:HAMP domain-containing sensor histidine kinase [Gemmatimonadaceae bacterium]
MLSVRTRLALALGALLFTVIGAYTVIVGALESEQLAVLHQREEDGELINATGVLALRIYRGYEDGALVTTRESADLPPTAGPVLTRDLASSVAGYFWVLDRHLIPFYFNPLVRDLPEADQILLDTLVRSIPLGGSAAHRDSITRAVSPPAVQRLTVRGREFLLYAVGVSYRPNGVDRVVVGRFATPPDKPSLGSAFLVMIPIIVLVAFGAAEIFTRITVGEVDSRIDVLMNEVQAISDGRSLHRRLPAEDESVTDSLGRLTHTLNEMIARLEQSFSALRRFTGDASHELKTPLTVLRADVERAMSTQMSPGDQLVALEEALAEITRMSDLVDSLLTLARADEGRFDLHREPVDLQALARDVFETATLLGENRRITARMPPPPPARVQGDAGRLRQLFLNLITNAIKYTPPEGTVDLALAINDGRAEFSVRDSGIGIAAADLPHVFDRFWRADHARSRVGERGGFGLGLAISQYIAHAHGGTLTVASRLGRGSVFTVALPLSTESDGEKTKKHDDERKS